MEDSDSDSDEETDVKITFSKWGKDTNDKLMKLKITMDLEEANELWKDAVKRLKDHIHKKRVQAARLGV